MVIHLSPIVRRLGIAAGLGVGTTGVLSGVLLLGPLTATILLVVVFVLVWPVAVVIKHVADEPPKTAPILIAAATSAAVLCLPGLVRLLAWGALGIAVALIMATLFVLIELVVPEKRPRLSRQQRKLTRLSEMQMVEDEELIASLQCPLSIEELCGVWTETVNQLARGAGPRDRQAVAEVRRICMDEFERQNPDGFHRWLDAGAPANPRLYLLPMPGEGQSPSPN